MDSSYRIFRMGATPACAMAYQMRHCGQFCAIGPPVPFKLPIPLARRFGDRPRIPVGENLRRGMSQISASRPQAAEHAHATSGEVNGWIASLGTGNPFPYSRHKRPR
jgi:hypothetical protein